MNESLLSLHLPPDGLRVSNSKSCPLQIEMAGRAKLDKAGEQVTALLFGLRDAVVDDSGVTASTPELRQRGGISQQADPIFHVENAYPRWRVIDMGDAKIQS